MEAQLKDQAEEIERLRKVVANYQAHDITINHQVCSNEDGSLLRWHLPGPNTFLARQEHSKKQITFNPIRTTLREKAHQDDRHINVESLTDMGKKMKKGQQVRIGRTDCDMLWEPNIVASISPLPLAPNMGVIHLQWALKIEHEPGDPVTVYDGVPAYPTHPYPPAGVPPFLKQHEELLKIPEIPTHRKDIGRFHGQLVDNVAEHMQGVGDKETWLWLDIPLDADPLYDGQMLDHVPMMHRQLERDLQPALIEACKVDSRLFHSIRNERHHLGLSSPPLEITSLRILANMFERLKTDKKKIEVTTMADLTSIQWENIGDEQADEFWSMFLSALTYMQIPVHHEHARDCLRLQMGKSHGLRFVLKEYDQLPKHKRTYDELSDVLEEWLFNQRQLRALRVELTPPREIKAVEMLPKATGPAKGKGRIAPNPSCPYGHGICVSTAGSASKDRGAQYGTVTDVTKGDQAEAIWAQAEKEAEVVWYNTMKVAKPKPQPKPKSTKEICPKHFECPGREIYQGGTGSCYKIHTAVGSLTDYAKAMSEAWWSPRRKVWSLRDHCAKSDDE